MSLNQIFLQTEYSLTSSRAARRALSVAGDFNQFISAVRFVRFHSSSLHEVHRVAFWRGIQQGHRPGLTGG